MKFDAALRDEYRVLFQTCQVRDGAPPWNPRAPWKELVETTITAVLRGGKRYAAVGDALGAPFYFVGIVHAMECSSNFNLHLHNGNPLCKPTVDVPAGRPEGEWPIPGATADELWQASAVDALKLKGLNAWVNWTAEGMLYQLERYNGFGYRAHGVNSPYLFSGSQHYRAGKYVADHVWSRTAVSRQIGAAVILRRMVDQSLIEIKHDGN